MLAAATTTVATTASTPGAAVAAMPGLGQTMLSLVLVLIVIFGLAALLKRLQGVRSGGTAGLRITAGLQVGPKERVLLIEAGGQYLLIGVSTSGGVQTLHVYPEAPAVSEVTASRGASAIPPMATAFAEAMKRALGQTAKP